jgi:multiple sugar transport system substrate-binding protein
MRALARKTAVLLAATAAAVSLTAVAASSAASQQAAAKKVTLTYFTFSAAPDHLKELQAIVQAFERTHPNTRIKILTASYNDYWTKLQTMIAGGNAPDVFELNYENFVTYAESGRLLNTTPIAKADRTFKPATYYPRAYQAFQLRGRQYALPETFSVVLLFYNKDLFRKAGVALPTKSWRWKHEIAAAKQLTDRAQGIWGDFQPVQFWEYYKVLAQNNGTFFNAAKTRTTFNGTRGVAALNWLLNKTRLHGVMPTKGEMGGLDDTALFKSGRLAMWHNGIWQFDGLKDAAFDWDVIVEPGNARKAHHFFANAVAASAKTKNPGHAWAFMRFFTSNAKAVKTRVDSAWELPAVTDQKLFSRYLGATPPANREAVFEALNAIVTPPVVAKQTELQDILNRWLEKATTDSSLSAQDTLNGAAGEVNALLASAR